VIPFVQSLDLDDPEHVLLDATWSEGAVVLDVDRKKLLVSGGETIGPDPRCGDSGCAWPKSAGPVGMSHGGARYFRT